MDGVRAGTLEGAWQNAGSVAILDTKTGRGDDAKIIERATSQLYRGGIIRLF